jgi:hypothetical protein
MAGSHLLDPEHGEAVSKVDVTLGLVLVIGAIFPGPA